MQLIERIQEELTRLKPSDRRALFIVIAFLIVMGSYIYLIEPLVMGYQQAQTALSELTVQQRRYTRQVSLLPRREAKLAQYRAEWDALTRRFNLHVESQAAVVPQSITELTYYARLANVTVSGIRPLEPLTVGDIREFPFELEASGEHENLRKFFYYIDTSPSLMAITDLDVSARRQGHNRLGSSSPILFVCKRTRPRRSLSRSNRTIAYGWCSRAGPVMRLWWSRSTTAIWILSRCG